MRANRRVIPFSRQELQLIFDYSPLNGWLVWKERPSHMFATKRAFNCWNSRSAGKRAGRISAGATGYVKRIASINNTTYYEHRIIWKIMTGDEPPFQIDHINRDATDNRWENLRDGTEINHLSRSRNSRNTSGISGISKDKRFNYWKVEVCKDGKRNPVRYFYDENFDLAVLELMEQRLELGFDPTHGLNLPHYLTSP